MSTGGGAQHISGLDQNVTRVRALGRCRFQSVNAVARLKFGNLRPGGRDGAGEIIAEHYRKLARAQERQEPPAIALGAPHADRIDGGSLHGDLDFVGRWILSSHLPDPERTLGGRPEAKQCSFRFHWIDLSGAPAWTQRYATVILCSPRSSRPSALRIVAVMLSPGLRYSGRCRCDETNNSQNFRSGSS